jgi:hypothetical protein
MSNISYISGEKIQLEMDLFITTPEYLNNNPIITINHPKAFNINNINSNFDNPRFIYTCSDTLNLIKDKLDFFNNVFILVSHNSDFNIINNDLYNSILNHPKIIKWYSQNVMFNHPKLEMIPIGFANEKWKHGNSKIIMNTINNLNNIKKINDIYFYFNLHTNYDKRNDCYQKLRNNFPISDKKIEEDYFDYLATFKFAICPEGNGIDTHRLWECFYFKVIPIVLDNPFIRIVKDKYKLPMIILNDWSDLIRMKLTYEDFDNSILDFNLLISKIKNENENENKKPIMTLIYSFIGSLPSYIIECIYQTRLFFKGNIYLIIDDINSKFLEKLINDYNIIIINYYDVIDNNFIKLYEQYNRFWEAPFIKELKGREYLMIRSYERLYIVNNLIKKFNLKDVLTLEIDNLIYNNPDNLLDNFRRAGDYTAMITCHNNYSICYMYIKNGLDKIINFMNDFIINDIYRTEYHSITEMKALYAYSKYNNDLYLLPVFFNRPDMHIECYQNYNKFDDTIFDGNGHGIKLLGRDSYHKNPLYQLFINELDNTIIYKWEKNKDDLLIPYLYDTINNKWLLINNLHIHSKDLYKGLSKPLN